MKTRSSSLPVLVVVAVVALVLGSIGTAVAGPAVTKKKVKSIATKVVKKQAATLSVASATNAANAANAANADKVDGLDSSQLQSRIVEGTETSPAGGGVLSADATVATVTITAPAAGFVTLTGQAYLNASAGSNYLYAYVYEGTTKLKAVGWDAGDKDGYYDQSQTIVAVAPVTAGTHTYTLRVTESTAGGFSNFGGGQLIAEFSGAGSAPAGPGFKPGQ